MIHIEQNSINQRLQTSSMENKNVYCLRSRSGKSSWRTFYDDDLVDFLMLLTVGSQEHKTSFYGRKETWLFGEEITAECHFNRKNSFRLRKNMKLKNIFLVLQSGWLQDIILIQLIVLVSRVELKAKSSVYFWNCIFHENFLWLAVVLWLHNCVHSISEICLFKHCMNFIEE